MVYMGEGEELWNKYCSFYDKPFSEQLEYNENKLKEHFERFKQTKMFKQLCPKGVEKFEEVPLTTYEDYKILHEFGAQIEDLNKKMPREKGESFWDYYGRIGKLAAPMLDGWLVNGNAICAKTSGTTGGNKWLVHGMEFWENFETNFMASAVMACSNEWGTTELRKGDTLLNVGPPIPYISGYMAKCFDSFFKLVPPLEVTDEIVSFRKKVTMAMKLIEKGARIDFLGGMPSGIYQIYRYLSDKERFFKEYYQSMKIGFPKLILFLIWLKCKISRKKPKEVTEIMPLKAIGGGGIDIMLYLDFFREELGLEYLNGYGSTELGTQAFGRPDRKSDLVFNLNCCYHEFLTKEGEIKRIDELSRDTIYEVVGTAFGSPLVRYKIGDLVKVIDYSDGAPVFVFEGRTVDFLDVYGWFRLTRTTAQKALQKAGLPLTEKWAITKEIEPTEKLRILMEKEWEYSEKGAAERIFKALRETCIDFNSYVEGLNIKNPSDVVEVEYLRRGAFLRYTMKKTKDGLAIGQLKPPNIILAEKKEIADLLRIV